MRVIHKRKETLAQVSSGNYIVMELLMSLVLIRLTNNLFKVNQNYLNYFILYSLKILHSRCLVASFSI